MLSRFLREGLSRLIRQGTAAGTPAPAGGEESGAGSEPSRSGAEPRFERARIEEILPGGILEGPHGTVFVHERLYSDIGERPEPVLERLAALCEPGIANGSHRAREPRVVTDDGLTIHRPADLPALVAQVDWPERGLFRRFGYRRMLFLDIETCALSGAPVFLAGLALVGEGDLVLRQLFARDYTEERALLHELDRTLAEVDFLVSFNGKAFDAPYLRDRAVHHRIPLRMVLPHLDLLWMARRRWKGRLPDYKLKTLEWHVLRRRRAGDVWGFEIPGLYHDYVQRGEPHRLVPVFHHNMLDVVAMVELVGPIFDPETEIYGAAYVRGLTHEQ